MHGVYIFHIVSPLKQTIHKIIEEIEDNVRSKETEDNMRYSDGANTPILDSMILLLMQCRILAIGLELLIIVCYWFFFPLFHSTRVNSLLCWCTELAKAHGLEGKNLDLIKYPPSIASSIFSNEEITSQPYGRHPVMLLPAVPVIASSIKEFLCKDPHCLNHLPLECVSVQQLSNHHPADATKLAFFLLCGVLITTPL